jgi:hypothetical protein
MMHEKTNKASLLSSPDATHAFYSHWGPSYGCQCTATGAARLPLH